jgi:ornithine--oxo-acid transaminase
METSEYLAPTTESYIALEDRYNAHNYRPLDVVLTRGEGVWVWDVEGRRYLDCLSAYSAVNQGHCHPRIVAAMIGQARRLALTSRAFRNDQLPFLARELCELLGYEMMLPMNSGAEAVETAIKAARKWGYTVKGVPDGRAEVIACRGNFHGRTITAVSLSSEAQYREGYAPYTPGFTLVPYGDAGALERAITPQTVAFLVEPIQGEAGVIVPPDGYLREVREICTQQGVLMMADEIQTALGRTGSTFACEHEGVEPDVYILGKALGGGIVPLSAVVANRDVLGVLTPGTHGSTFGGNPFACAIGRKVIEIVETGEFQERSKKLGEHMLRTLRDAGLAAVTEVRGRGLWAGIELAPEAVPARAHCETLLERGVLAKDTHESTIRLAPPLVITEEDLDWALEQVLAVLEEATR